MSRASVAIVPYAAHAAALHAVRHAVFVQEQAVPEGLERDGLDAACSHALARDPQGEPVGAGRLQPDGKVGRMAVLPAWRGRGVGAALLQALVEQARRQGLPVLHLHAQADAEAFYAAHGFLPEGERFTEAGIVHQAMRRGLAAPLPVEDAAQAAAALVAVLASARRGTWTYSRELDPGLLDRPEVLAAYRRFATRGGEARLLLQDVETPQRAHAPLIALVQRLPSAFAVRVIDEPVDLNYPGAFACNDTGGWYYRPLGHRLDGEAMLDNAARVRQLRTVFDAAWERARPATELRALGI